MIKVLVFILYAVSFASVFLGFYFLDNDPELSLMIVTGGMVGIVGILSFVTHVIFHKADAARLGWETDQPDWQFEVGFANLAFGLTAFITLLSPFPTLSRVAIIFAYAIYLFQAAFLHSYRALETQPANLKKLLLSGGLTFIYIILMLFFAFAVIS
jgi:hypothetical protein